MTMHRKFIALIIGAALTVSSLAAAPVQAQNRGETAAIIAGVAALAIVGAAISDDRNRDRDRRHDYVSRGHGYKQPHYAPKRHHKHGYNPGHYRHHYSQNRYYEPQRDYGRSYQGRPAYQRSTGNHVPYHRDDHRN